MAHDSPETLLGTLQNDQRNFILQGWVCVAKNPCLHPGDVRVLKAVDHPILRQTMRDCVVFPAVGDRPIPDMCSGSDLDGDLYFVSWEKSLIPPNNFTEKPMSYEPPPAQTLDSPVDDRHLVRFIVDFISDDHLGPIANAHLAHSDLRSAGVRDELCCELAYLFSLAVDFPKTGVLATLPKTAKVHSYPDFMQIRGKQSYPSEKVIGYMYRKCRKLALANVDMSLNLKVDQRFLTEGYEVCLEIPS